MKWYLLLILNCAWMIGATRLGVSTSAFQIEGGRDERQTSIWDTFSYMHGHIRDGSNADVACDHFHKWEEDLDRIEWLGATVYRFSISWPRIMSPGGIDFYHRLLDGLHARNILPIATLSHWDIPQSVQDSYGGWENDEIIHDLVEYSRQCFTEFGDKIKYWLTLNEPWTVAQMGYGNGHHAPGIKEPSVLVYEVAHRMIRAHAAIYHVYHDEFASRQGGKISIALNSDFIQPLHADDPEDEAAAQRGLLWRIGWFADPIFFGDYPEEMRARCGERLPYFSMDVSGTMDFFALNHYTTLDARNDYNSDYNVFRDAQADYRFPHGSNATASKWLHVYPQGIYGMIRWIQERYGLREKSMELIITESGVSTYPTQFDDQSRIDYINEYIENVLRARDEFDINLFAYCIWSLMDNFEWAAGYTERYGLYNVDFDTLERTPKKSAMWLRDQDFFS